MKPTQQQIDEAAKHGIAEGATIRSAYSSAYVKEGIVPPSSEWETDDQGNMCAGSFGCAPWIYDNQDSKWATVITPTPSKEEEGLKEGDACECGPAMRAAIVELAKELGLWHVDGMDQRGDKDIVGLWFASEAKAVYWCAVFWSDNTMHTPEEFMRRMRVTAKKPKPIKIGDHTVKFTKEGISVGCTSVDFATLEAVYNEAKKNRP